VNVNKLKLGIVESKEAECARWYDRFSHVVIPLNPPLRNRPYHPLIYLFTRRTYDSHDWSYGPLSVTAAAHECSSSLSSNTLTHPQRGL